MQIPLSILIYRRVLASPDPLFPEHLDARRFELQMRLLRRWFRVLPLAVAVRRLRQRCLPGRAACITFDGGYAEHAGVALPVLQRHGLTATFFAAGAVLDGGDNWSDALVELVRAAPGPRLNLARFGFASYDIGCVRRRRAVIDTLQSILACLDPDERLAAVRAMARPVTSTMLTSDQLLALHRAGMEVGAQPACQARPSGLSNVEACAEIALARRGLEQLIQAPVRLFAFPQDKPGCDFAQRHASVLHAQGFDAAVTTAAGAARAGSDPYALPRLNPRDASGSAFLLRLGRNLLLPA